MRGAAPPGKREKGRLGRYLTDPETKPPPAALVEGRLLKLFGFTKSLEEIEEMDQAWLNRALEALDYAGAWERHHAPKGLAAKAQAREDEAARRQADWAKVEELVRLAADETVG